MEDEDRVAQARDRVQAAIRSRHTGAGQSEYDVVFWDAMMRWAAS